METNPADYAKHDKFGVLVELANANDEIKRLRAALSWYADTNNYKSRLSDPVSSSGQHRASPVERDYGEIARGALVTE